MKNGSNRFYKESTSIGGEEAWVYSKTNAQGKSHARFACIPAKGCLAAALQLDGVDLIYGYREGQELDILPAYRSCILAPFPNRIRNGKYTFEGKTYQFPKNDVDLDHGLHGFVWNKAFDLKTEFLGDELELCFTYDYDGAQAYYPFPFNLSLTYYIEGDAFRFKIDCTNNGDGNMPIGLGWHPYFKQAGKIESLLHFENEGKVEIDQTMIPIGSLKAKDFVNEQIDDLLLDNSFKLKQLPEDEAQLSIHFRNGKTWDKDKVLYLYAEEGLEYFHFYKNQNMNAIAIEPMSCNIDAFNNGEGLQVLHPGQTFGMSFRMVLKNKV